LLLSLLITNVRAQGWLVEENTFETNWNATFQVGRSALLSEMLKDFSGISNDMNNLSDWAFNVQLAKMVYDRMDVGFEFGVSNFRGYKNNPSNVNYLMRYFYFHTEGKDFQPYSIYYDSDITNFTLFTRYNFINFSSFARGYLNLNLYAKVGLGMIFISTEMGYKDKANYEFTGLEHPLYVKGRYSNMEKSSHVILSGGLGLNYQLTERIFFSGESNFQLLNADYVDGVHNYDSSLTPNMDLAEASHHRVQVYDITGKFLIGITYFFNLDTHHQLRMSALPWYDSRYRSYFSKYHNPKANKAFEEYLPFSHKKPKK